MRRAWAVGLSALVAGLALGQDDPLAPPAPDEAALRRETGAMLARLERLATTPPAEEALLELDLDERGRPFGARRVVEVSVRRHGLGEDVRLRFREPAELRDRAFLLLADGRSYAYDPARRRADRAQALEPSWRVGGGGLLLRDLRAPAWGGEDDRWTHVHVRDDRALVDGDDDTDGEPGRAVHVVRSTPPGGGRVREAWLDRARRVPLVCFEREGDEVVREVRARDWRRVERWLRPFALEITEPGEERVTRVVARAWRASAPAPRFDPARFFE